MKKFLIFLALPLAAVLGSYFYNQMSVRQEIADLSCDNVSLHPLGTSSLPRDMSGLEQKLFIIDRPRTSINDSPAIVREIKSLLNPKISVDPVRYVPGAEDGDACAMYKVAFLYSLPPVTEERTALSTSWYERITKGEGISNPSESTKVVQGWAAYELGSLYESRFKFEDAVDWFIPAVEKGHAVAQLKMASYFFEGRPGTPVDIPKAMQLIKAALESGYVPAYHDFGNIYRFGRYGFSHNQKRAAEYHLIAAEKGYIESQKALAIMHTDSSYSHYSHQGFEQDVAEGLRWALSSGEDPVSAMTKASEAYSENHDFEEARVLAEEVGKLGDLDQKKKLLEMIETHETDKQRKEAAQKAAEARRQQRANQTRQRSAERYQWQNVYQEDTSPGERLLRLLGRAIVADIANGLSGGDSNSSVDWRTQAYENRMRELNQGIAMDQALGWAAN